MLNIVLLGLVSFFSDISSEMVYPLIPLYLTGAFGATPALVGVIEGAAESIAALLKVFSGYLTDRYRHKKQTAFVGYAAGIVYKAALLIASSWGGILAARVIDRIGKGIRTSPRDVLVSESSQKGKLGSAFGIHKALDMAGSAIGIILAFFLLSRTDGEQYKSIFAISIIPAIIGLAMLLFVKEKKREQAPAASKEKFWKNYGKISFNLKLYILVTFVFTLGNSSNAFLLLKAKGLGFTDTNVVLLYFVYNVTAALLSVPFGKLSDAVGRKKVLVCGYFVFSLVYTGFAFAKSSAFLVAMFVLYGFYTALVAGAERAMIAEISPPELKGTMLGLHSTAAGVALLPASVIAGALWNTMGDKAPFVFGASLSLIAAMSLILLMNRKKETQNEEN